MAVKPGDHIVAFDLLLFARLHLPDGRCAFLQLYHGRDTTVTGASDFAFGFACRIVRVQHSVAMRLRRDSVANFSALFSVFELTADGGEKHLR